MLFVVAENEYVFVVGLHEVALTSYFRYGLGIALEFLQRVLVLLVLAVVSVDFALHSAYFHAVLHMFQDAVVAYEAHQQHAENDDDEVFLATYEV